MKSLGNIQKAMEWSSSSRLADLELDVREELECMLNHEELLWRQKVRCDWLQFRDRNTKYFHSRTIRRRKFNRIMALCTSSGEWSSDQSTLSDKEDDFDFLNKPILNDEIKNALFDMSPLKVPERRVTLAQSVLLAIPNFFMQSLMVPKGVCDEIEKITRQFI
ncbi:hypothetical protein J1N35_019997 [Gossypium stocksii]|uniref:Uncharacterized protein n=1 Tax=Gossypium stocksii TaxID=47602 RepID=A0A9D3VCE2_9ROSI|nr:hypothetical protein J1N35_019997 [Gossypium stocksii]